MGILLQTEHLTKENRKQIFDALSDMVRHLRNDDEVFIMAYGKKLDFEQDLTGNPKLLEEAMSQIQHPVTDLFWYSMSSNIEEANLRAGLIDFLSNRLTI